MPDMYQRLAELNSQISTISFEWDWLNDNATPETVSLVALTEQQSQILLSLLFLADQRHLWEEYSISASDWEAVKDTVECARYKLMAGCDTLADLIKTNRIIAAAIAGQAVDLTSDVPDAVDFTETGISPRLAEAVSELDNIDDAVGALRIDLRTQLELQVAQLTTVNTRLDEIRQAIAAQAGGDPESLADDLEGIADTIQIVATVLGALA